METQVVPSAPVAPPPASLMLRHGDRTVRLVEMRSYAVGRGPESTLCVPDPEMPRVSTVHLKIEHSAMGWFVEDISRNGTWLRDGTTGEVRQLPHISRVMLPRGGDLCLGRPFTDDPKRQFTVSFSATDA